MRSMSSFRRAVLLIALLLLALFAAYAGYWHYMAARLRDGLVPWAKAQLTKGYDLHWNHVEIGGFPYAFTLRFTRVHLDAARPVPVTLTAPKLSISATPWNLRHWRFDLPSGGRVADPLNLAGFTFARLYGSTEPNDAGALTFGLSASGLGGTGFVQHITAANTTVHVEVPRRPPKTHLDTALRIALRLSDVTLPVKVPGFGKTLNGLSFSLQMKGGLPPGALPRAIAAWRDDGGTIDLLYARLHWDSLLIDASGTLALDSALQPEGAFSTVITGQNAAVNLAVSSGALLPADADLVKTILAVLAKPGPNGEKAITVPITLQNSRIFLGPAAIGKIPHIRWE